MANINLLPQGATLKGRDRILLDGLRKFVLVGFMIFIAAALVITGYLIYTSLRIRSSIANEETLKPQVNALRQTEQSFFLIKDRVSKIKTVFGKESANAQITTLSGFLRGVFPDARVLEIQITSQKVNLGVIFPTSSAFGAFYKTLIDADLYKTVILKSFSFNPSAGYIATFALSQK